MIIIQCSCPKELEIARDPASRAFLSIQRVELREQREFKHNLPLKSARLSDTDDVLVQQATTKQQQGRMYLRRRPLRKDLH